MSSTLVTSIVLKSNVTLVDVVSTRMLGQYGFLARVFEVFNRHRVSVDMVATSEVRACCVTSLLPASATVLLYAQFRRNNCPLALLHPTCCPFPPDPATKLYHSFPTCFHPDHSHPPPAPRRCLSP
jgi:hypothetical protein